MERRRDYRLGLNYELTLTEEHAGKVWSGLVTADVSATGLAFRSREPHGFLVGERFEVRLLAQVDGRPQDESMVLSTSATLIRSENCGGAVAFDAPLKY
ncbi:MAG: PilZ domain-containing protein [Planctomycetota bacterium]|jgi:hypothetical protein